MSGFALGPAYAHSPVRVRGRASVSVSVRAKARFAHSLVKVRRGSGLVRGLGLGFRV